MTTEYSEERRKFLKSVVILGGAVATLSAAQETAMPGKPDSSLPKTSAQGYRETEHISKYYRSAGN